MQEVLKNVTLKQEFADDGVTCYSLEGGNYVNEYYVVSEKESRKLLNSPEVVGFEVYKALLKSTTRMIRMFSEQGKVSSANILSILRGALNYPLEEACYNEGVRIHDISFLSSERVFQGEELAGLDIKYSKLATVPDSTLMIGDIIASGDTLVHCLKYVIDNYRAHGAKLRNIVFFTIGGTKGISLMEKLTGEIREYWPEFEGFITVYYEGVFTCWDDKGVAGIQIPNIDFGWNGGIMAPQYRMETLEHRDALFEKCTIYDGGARRYEIADHIHEVMEYWEAIKERANIIDKDAFITERIGYQAPISYEEWVKAMGYDNIREDLCQKLYRQEQAYLTKISHVSLDTIASKRLEEFTQALQKYINHS